MVLYANGSLAIEGDIADSRLAKRVLLAAAEAAGHKDERETLVIPAGYHDPTQDPRYPRTPVGDR